MDSTVLGENIRRLRSGAGMTQIELTRLSGATSVAMIESGHISSPRLDTLKAIASALGVTLSDLYRDDSTPRQVLAMTRKRKRRAG